MLETIASILLGLMNWVSAPQMPAYPIELRSDKATYKVGEDVTFTLHFKEGATIHEAVAKSLSFHVYLANPNGLERSGQVIPSFRWVFSKSADPDLRKNPAFQNERFRKIEKNGVVEIKGKIEVERDPLSESLIESSRDRKHEYRPKAERMTAKMMVDGFGEFTTEIPTLLDVYFWYCPKKISFFDSLEDYSNPIRIRIED